MTGLSPRRLYSLLRKEWVQVRRDPMTLRLIIALPIMQLFLFGYAINTNPHNLPTGLLISEPTKYERTIVTALENTGYYDIKRYASEEESEQALARGEAHHRVGGEQPESEREPGESPHGFKRKRADARLRPCCGP